MPVLEAFAEAINDGFVAVDSNWRITYLNRQARLMLRQPDTREPLSLQDLIADDPKTSTWRELRRALAQQVTVEVDVFYPAFFSWHEVRAFPLEGGLGLILRDITDRQWLLRKEAERGYLRNLFNDAPIALSILRGPQHQFEFINDFARQLIGNRNVDGLTVREAFPELEQQGFFELLDQVYQTGEAVEGAERRAQLTHPHTGEVRDLYVNYAYVPLRGFDAEVSGVLSLSVDVTAYVQARLDREQEAEARTAILSHLQQGVIVTDPHGRIIFVNDEAARLHGGKQLDVTPDHYTDTYRLLTVDGDPHPVEDLPLTRAVRGEVIYNARWRIARPDGSSLLVMGSANPVFAGDGSKIGAVLTVRPVEDSGA